MSVNHPTDHSLAALLHQRIAAAGGVIPFDLFMQAALYEPGLGYYESEHVFGAEGDFVTGAELGPWLALGFADLIHWGWQQLGSPGSWTLIEQGGGSGRLLTGVLQQLERLGMPAPRIVAVELSSHMRERQRQHYEASNCRVEQFASLRDVGAVAQGIMFCNELPDAFPVRCLIKEGGRLCERGVASDDRSFRWRTMQPPADGPGLPDELLDAWPDGYISEWNPNLAAWQRDVAALLRDGFLFCVDYGYTRQEYYRPQRVVGTLMGHRGHRVVENVLEAPGSCDITAHIDFTALCEAGMSAGLDSGSFISQGGWLAQSPSVQAEVQALAAKADAESMAALAHAKRMMLPFGMGESFKLLVQGTRGPEKPRFIEAFDHLAELKTLIDSA